MSAQKNQKALSLLQDVRRELSASALLVASESGQALMCAGNEDPQTMSLLAALGAAGLSALQEVVAASFRSAADQGEQLLSLEVSNGLILILALPPLLFLAVLNDKSRLGLARLLLRRLAAEHAWEAMLLQTRPQDLPDLASDEEDRSQQLFRNLWAR